MDTKQLLARIDTVDDKTACLVVKVLTQELAKAAPADARSPAGIAPHITGLAAEAGLVGALDTDGAWGARELNASESAAVARALLRQLASQPGGDDLVQIALEKYPDTTQDLGILSIGVAAGFLYLAVVCGIDIKIGGVRITKPGLTRKQQVEVAKSLLPSFLKGAFGMAKG